MYEHVLIPVDGSKGSRGAVERGLDIAKTYGATVHALYAVEPIYLMDANVDQVVSALESEGEAATEDVAKQAEAAGVEVETHVEQGEPYRAILDYADDHDVDLIVMGTHGRTGLNKLLLGSVTEKVVRSSNVPVMTVRLGDEEETPEA